MAFYTEPRLTQNIDLLIEPNELEKVRQILEKNGYVESAEPWAFKSTSVFRAKSLVKAQMSCAAASGRSM